MKLDIKQHPEPHLQITMPNGVRYILTICANCEGKQVYLQQLGTRTTVRRYMTVLDALETLQREYENLKR